MNLLLLEPNDFINNDTVTISDDRLRHIHKVLSATKGDSLSAGLINEKMGSATITELTKSSVSLVVNLNQEPPKPLPLTVILALSRPKMMRRIFRNIAELGVKELYLINSYKVEKSYWQSPVLVEDSIQQYLKEGLVQAKDTVMPKVTLRNRFKPFVEDELNNIIGDKEAFVAHPYNTELRPQPSNKERVIAIGPEGGFIDYEIEHFINQGMKVINMGERIYRVENALTLLSTQLCH